MAEVTELSDKYDEEVAFESQGQSLELMDSQISEYNKLKEKAGKKAAAVQTQLDKINREQKSEKESLLQSTQRRNDLQVGCYSCSKHFIIITTPPPPLPTMILDPLKPVKTQKIGQNFGEQKCRKSGLLPKILSAENFCLQNIPCTIKS